MARMTKAELETRLETARELYQQQREVIREQLVLLKDKDRRIEELIQERDKAERGLSLAHRSAGRIAIQ